jgi:hypothetical protein
MRLIQPDVKHPSHPPGPAASGSGNPLGIVDQALGQYRRA